MMKYCVIKDTAQDIAQSEDTEKLIKSGESSRASNGQPVEFEIITEEVYRARKALEPASLEEPTLVERNRADIDYLSIMTGVEFYV